jgi:hypothetical protein
VTTSKRGLAVLGGVPQIGKGSALFLRRFLWRSGGWLAFPGTGQGVWSIQINYTGHPAFGGTAPQVTIVGDKWSFLFLNGLELRGKVISGTVTWPADQNSPVAGSDCGNGVAVAQANMTLVGGTSATVAGCLHDIPAGTVIPPTE